MTTILTAQNQTTGVEVITTGYHPLSATWQIVFVEQLSRVDPPLLLSTSKPVTLSIANIPEQPIYDEEGVQTGTTPADNKLDEWLATWNTMDELAKASLQFVIETRELSTWVDPADSIENEGDLLTGPWTEGEFVKKGWERTFEDIKYIAKQQHTCKVEPPKDPALWLGPDGEPHAIALNPADAGDIKPQAEK